MSTARPGDLRHLATSAIALLIAVPVSFGIALFLTELSPAWLKAPGTAIELLAAVPSIVYGMWGSWCLARFWRAFVQQPLQTAFSGVPYLGAFVSGPAGGHRHFVGLSIILAIMIIPFIASVMRDVFEVTPASKNLPYGLGATTWEKVWKVGASLHEDWRARRHHAGLGRALGETMAVTFVIGNMNQLDSFVGV